MTPDNVIKILVLVISLTVSFVLGWAVLELVDKHHEKPCEPCNPAKAAFTVTYPDDTSATFIVNACRITQSYIDADKWNTFITHSGKKINGATVAINPTHP
jgi:hypothetical protein